MRSGSGTLTSIPGNRASPGRRGRSSLPLWLMAAGLLFGWYLRLSQTRAVNSDGAGNALQAWDMLHGNLLLHGWLLTDVSFFTTELPQYLLVEAVTGLTAGVVHIAAAMTATLLVILAALLARNRAGMLLAAALMLAPQLGPGVNVLLSSPDHFGTAVPVLAAWLVLDRGRGRLVPAMTGLVLGWALVADPLVFWVGVLPLLLVCAVRIARGSRREVPLVVAALAGWAGSAGLLRLIRAAGGFTVSPVTVHLLRPAHLLANLQITGRGLLLLFGADVPDARPGLPALAAAVHLAGVLAAGWAVWLSVRRGRQDPVAQLLLAGMLIDLAAYVASNRVANLPATREIDVLLPFGAALTGRMAGPWLTEWLARWRPAQSLPAQSLPAQSLPAQSLPAQVPPAPVQFALVRLALAAGAGVLVLAGCLPALAALGRPPAAAQQHRLGRWLAARHLTSGLSGYWEANVVTLDTGGRVRIRAIQVQRHRVIPGNWATDTAWYDPRRASASYVVLFRGVPGYPGFRARRAVLATFGQPARRYRFRRYQILVWHRNLLAELQKAELRKAGLRKAQFQNSNGSSMRSPPRKPGSSSGSRPG